MGNTTETNHNINPQHQTFDLCHWSSTQLCINEQILNHGGIGIFCPKNTNLSPEETVLHNTVAEFDRTNLVYHFEMGHSNNREHVIHKLETYGYSRKGGIGDTRKV